MARLNEPVVPMESIESLKRKFMRQNRDIARANSTQSVRIRNLENEISNLLAENLSLREQLSRYKLELEGGRAQRIADHTGEVKAQLEEKLQELGALISGLGHAPRSKKQSPKRGKITIINPSQNPSSRAWRNEAAEQEGRLPPILEHKSYPRKTLERQEIVDIVANTEVDSTDSPEIGPPPVSQFVDEDPVKIDLPKRTRPQANEEISGLDPSLSINLEQRRKRKDSLGSSESRRSSRSELVVDDSNLVENLKTGGRPSQNEPVLEDQAFVGNHKTGGRSNRSESVMEDQRSAATHKTGAKRKLSVREDEESQSVTRSVETPDDFRFTRVTHEDRTKGHSVSQAEKPAAKATRELAIARGAPRIKQTESIVSTTRKVLAPKSVNNSPRKAGRPVINDEAKPVKPDAPKFNPTKDRRERRQEPVQVKPPSAPTPPPIEAIIVEPEPEPETPACLDLFSPPSSQPSTTRVDSRDTPPPSELGSGAEGQRPSRRARGAVSYAEPNLRDKMRRPTKDLIDAVARDDKAQRGSSFRMEDGSLSMETGIKTETETENDWKEMPAASSATVEGSPLSSKASVPESLPNNITTHRKRRESLLLQIEADDHKSGSGSAIAALLAETRKAKAAAREKGKERAHEGNAIANGMSKLEIYEVKDLSSQAEIGAKDVKENRAPGRASRRHSTMPHEPTPDDSEASDMEGPKKPEIPSSRRRQSSLGMKSSSSRNEHLNKDAASERMMKRSSSTTGMVESGPGDSRSDRMSARRRSMML